MDTTTITMPPDSWGANVQNAFYDSFGPVGHWHTGGLAQALITIARGPAKICVAYLDREMGFPLKGADLSQRDLVGCRFDGCQLAGVNMTGRNLEGCSFRKANLTGARMVNVKAKGVSFYGAVLKKADFYAADLTNAEMRRVQSQGANFLSATMYGLKSDRGFKGEFSGALADKTMLLPDGYFLEHGGLEKIWR